MTAALGYWLFEVATPLLLFQVVTDRPNGATPDRPNGATQVVPVLGLGRGVDLVFLGLLFKGGFGLLGGVSGGAVAVAVEDDAVGAVS